MRKMLLLAVLASFFCGVGIAWASEAVLSEAILGFGLLRTYSTDQPVILRVDEDPYYDNVTKLVGIDFDFAAQIKKGYTGALPYGTLTDMDTKTRYMLTPNEPSGNISMYDVQGIDSLSNFAKSKVMWNVYTSPDVIVAATTIPEDISAYTVSVDEGTIVPYVKINHNSDIEGLLGRVDVYFVQSGDKTYTPVALGDTTVNVYINNSSKSTSAPNFQFTNFNKAVRNSFNLNCVESEFSGLTVEYVKDRAKYIWNFVPKYQDEAEIDLGELALENQPLTLTTGTSKDITIKIPGRYDLSSYFANSIMASVLVSVGNMDVFEVESLSFDQGAADWDGITWNEDKSTLSFKLIAGEPGRTTLRVLLPYLGYYYREVRVTDESGDFVLSGDVPEGVSMQVSGHTTYARFVNGRPWYPSAVDGEDTYSFVLSGDNLSGFYGYFGMTNGTGSELHAMDVNKVSDNTRTYDIKSGVYYDTENKESQDNYPLSITEDDIENATVWAEFPDNPSFNVVSASLKSIVVSSDYMTTAKQLENFVPYFRMYDINETISAVSMDWYFVNPKTMEKVTPEVSNVSINYNDINGTSGTVNDASKEYVVFQYDYNGITYTWNFEEMKGSAVYGHISDFLLEPGASRDVTVNLSNYEALASVDVSIWDTEILSADPVSFAAAESISFDVSALNEGTTKITLVFMLADGNYYSSYDRYVRSSTTVTVASANTADEWTPGAEDLTASFHAGDGWGSSSIVEGSTLSYELADNETLTLKLSRAGTVSEDYYAENISAKQYGTLKSYSSEGEPGEETIEFERDSETSTLYITTNVESYTSVDWTPFTNSDTGLTLITYGSADVPSLTSSESFDFKPYIKLNRDGLNVSTLEYYFVNNSGDKIATPEGVSALSVKVTTHYGSPFYNEDESGTMSVNLPENFINKIDFAFTYNSVTYTSDFNFDSNNEENLFNVTWTDSDGNTDTEPALPLFMNVGESRDITLSYNESGGTYTPYIGNSAIVSMENLSADSGTLTLRLTAKAAGMTSITLVNNSEGYITTSVPREIWVAGTDGTIPHLNGTSADIYARLTSNDLTSGSSSGWDETGSSSGSSTDEDTDSSLKTTNPVQVLAGLSVYPRYALPTDPSGDLYSNMWDKVYNGNLSYGAYMFEDVVEVLASRDVTEVFNKVSADLISKDTPQILAIVLPEIEIQADGIYTFRIPTDNITAAGTKIFMYANDSDETATEMNYYPDSGDKLAEISGNDYINVAVYLNVGTYTPIFTAAATANDVNIINGALGPALTLTASTLTVSMDVSADSTVTLTPANAVGAVTYSANQTWVTFSGNVATFRPTAAGTYSVVITATDASGRTATVTITVTATEAGSASDDIRPVSPDQPAPVSPDVRPVSPDQPAPTSPDQPAPTPGGDTPGGETPGGVTPVSGTIETPSVDLQSRTIVERIVNLFRGLLSSITGDTEVEALSEENATVGTERSVDDVSEEELAQIPENEEPAIVLPIVRVQKPAVYIFGIDLSSLSVGAQIFLHMMPQPDTVADAEFSAAADTENACMFLNDEGEEITTVPENKHANVAAYMEPNYTYAPIVTVKASSSEGGDTPGSDTPGTDTPGTDTPGTDTPTTGSVGSSRGGCDSGFSFMALAVLGLLAKKRFVK